MRKTYLSLCATILFSFSLADSAFALQCRESTAPLFQAERNVPLRVNFYAEHALVHEPIPPPHPRLSGIIEYFEEGRSTLVAASFEARGKSRSKCQPKPLKIEFESRQTGNLFAGLDNEIKLVNECFTKDGWPGSPLPEIRKAMLLREFYVYQMLELLNPAALKTRLLDSRFVDREGKVYWQGYSILLEPVKDLRERCGLKKGVYRKEMLDPRSTFQVELLQAFIGNGDYLADQEHNIKLGVDANGILHLIPYDYDLSEMARRDSMGWNFAQLEVLLKTKLGDEEYPERREFVRKMLSKREEILALYANSLLDEKHKGLLKAALEKNFELLERLGR